MQHLLRISCLILLAGLPFRAAAQTSSISGIINQYSAVSAVSAATGELTVANPALFAPGDRVLVIQMQGASINAANSAAFGSVTAIGNAGNYEFATVCDVNAGASEVALERALVNTYSAAGLQLIRVPQYQNVLVTGTLTAQAWNGQTGGVLAFEATGSVQLDANIDVSGLGFRGAQTVSMNPVPSCSFVSNYNAYFYSSAQARGGRKGEGIAAYTLNAEFGRGTQANGGGGGNDQNGGGGGGGNYSAGGTGGQRQPSSPLGCPGQNPGIGGRTLAALGYSGAQPRIFLGGGGGAGHANNNEGANAGNGGGIILIRAASLNGNGRILSADGAAGVPLSGNSSDGGSGGGAGGAILLQISSYTANAFTIRARGGAGSSTNINCEGPGGGGAGGVIWSSAALPGTATRQVTGGAAGTSAAPACAGSTLNATAGTAGAELTGLNLTESGGSQLCVLPVELLAFDAEAVPAGVRLHWAAASEVAHAYYQIERQLPDEADFRPLAQIAPADGAFPRQYGWLDPFPPAGVLRYRLAMVDTDGGMAYSELRELRIAPAARLEAAVLEQPLAAAGPVRLALSLPQAGQTAFSIVSAAGADIWRQARRLEAGPQLVELDPGTLAAGVYRLRVQQGGQAAVLPLLVR